MPGLYGCHGMSKSGLYSRRSGNSAHSFLDTEVRHHLSRKLTSYNPSRRIQRVPAHLTQYHNTYQWLKSPCAPKITRSGPSEAWTYHQFIGASFGFSMQNSTAFPFFGHPCTPTTIKSDEEPRLADPEKPAPYQEYCFVSQRRAIMSHNVLNAPSEPRDHYLSPPGLVRRFATNSVCNFILLPLCNLLNFFLYRL